MIATHSIVDRLKGVKQIGEGKFQALCPAHDDHQPSLTVTSENGKVLLHCHAGCTFGQICAALNVDPRDLSSVQPKSKSDDILTYDYTDEFGRLLFQVCRNGKKKFWQRRPDGNGGWINNLNGTRRALYNLEELTRAKPDEQVFIPEGEKDVESLRKLGLLATTNPHGAGKWRKEYNRYLAGRKVVILPDNDEAGHEHARDIAHELLRVASEVKVVFLDDLPQGGDITQWLKTGGEVEGLKLRVHQESPLRLAGDKVFSTPIIKKLSEVQAREVEWLWPNRFAVGKLNLIVGDPQLGKSFLTHYIAARITNGLPWPDGSGNPDIGSVVLLSAEDGLSDTIVPRLNAHQADLNRIIAIEAVKKEDDERQFTFNLKRDLPALKLALDQTENCKCVIIDPISSFLGRTDSHNNTEVRGTLAPLSKFAEQNNVAVIAVSHLRKGEGRAISRVMGSMAFVAAARVVWAVAEDKEDPNRRLITKIKNNLAHSAAGLAFRLTGGKVCFEKGEINMTADEALKQPDEDERTAIEEAIEFLEQTLANGKVKTQGIFAAATENHISEKTLRRAAKKLNVQKKREGFGGFGTWYWQLPEVQR